MWTNKDAAFANIASGIRKVVDDLNAPKSNKDEQTTEGMISTKSENVGRKDIASTPAMIGSSILKGAIKRYNDELKCYQEVADYELGLRAAFQNLLADIAKSVGWSLAPELTIGKIRPDGVLLDMFRIRRGYWEAKGPNANLEKEIAKKIQDNYPLTNTIFENTEKAILYQGKKRFPVEFNLRNTNDVSDLLQQFFTYVEPDIENFEEAVEEFKGRIPDLAQGLVNIIKDEHKLNRRFIAAFNSFAELCRTSLDAKMNDEAINEMLVQHLLTERLFRTVFNNPDFVNNNAIASEIEKVVRALASRSFNRNEFLKSLDRFYMAIERAAKGIENWSDRQEFLNTVYERFFQGFSIKKADTHGIVYTPQEIVDFMVASVDEVLKREFGKSIDGSHRQENITDWVHEQFQKKYGMQITKRDILYYIYAILHHPQYRELYKEDLKRDLPRIPLLQREEACGACISVGKQLMNMHVNYEKIEGYALKEVDNGELPYDQSRRVNKKMRLSEDKTVVIVNKALTLEGIPQECFEYRLGNRSALEWVIDQYQVSTDKRSGIESDPNRLEDPEYIIRLVKRIVTLSTKTVELVKELGEAVTVDDWLNDTVESE